MAKVLGIDAKRPEEPIPPIANADPYAEEDPTVAEWAREHTPGLRDAGRYVYNLFPFLSWIGKYNWTWFLGDFIAGEYNHSQILFTVADLERHHGRRRCRPSIHGLRLSGYSRTSVRSLLILHGCPRLLVLRDFQGYYHWRISHSQTTMIETPQLTFAARRRHVSGHRQRRRARPSGSP